MVVDRHLALVYPKPQDISHVLIPEFYLYHYFYKMWCKNSLGGWHPASFDPSLELSTFTKVIIDLDINTK